MRRFLLSIWRGAGLKLGSDIVGRLLQYVLLWLAARNLGEVGFGDFSLALTVGYMVAQVADFGLQLFVQRELARLATTGPDGLPRFNDPEAAGQLVGGGLLVKAALSLIALVIIVVLVMLQPVANKPALVLVGLSMVLMTVLEYLAYCFRALRRLQNEALATVIGRGVNLALGAGLLLLGGGVWGLALAGNVAMLLSIALLYGQLRRYIRPVWRLDWSFWRRSAWQPAALGVGIVFSIISFRIDNLLIAPLVGRAELGAYNVAYKLFEPSLIIPSVVLAATFPLLSKAAAGLRTKDGRGRTHVDAEGPSGFRQVFNNTMLLLLGLGVLASLSMSLFAVPIIGFLYSGQYAISGPILQVLALVCLPIYLNYGLTHVLIALDKPHLYAAFTLAGLIVNVVTNLALLGPMGIMGAAVATLLTEATLLVLCSAAVWRVVAIGRGVPSLGDVRHDLGPERSAEGSF